MEADQPDKKTLVRASFLKEKRARTLAPGPINPGAGQAGSQREAFLLCLFDTLTLRTAPGAQERPVYSPESGIPGFC